MLHDQDRGRLRRPQGGNGQDRRGHSTLLPGIASGSKEDNRFTLCLTNLTEIFEHVVVTLAVASRGKAI